MTVTELRPREGYSIRLHDQPADEPVFRCEFMGGTGTLADDDLGGGDQCGREAGWIVHRTPCPTCGRNPKFFCTEHKDYVLTLPTGRTDYWWCPGCDTVHAYDDVPLRVYAIEPIR